MENFPWLKSINYQSFKILVLSSPFVRILLKMAKPSTRKDKLLLDMRRSYGEKQWAAIHPQETLMKDQQQSTTKFRSITLCIIIVFHWFVSLIRVGKIPSWLRVFYCLNTFFLFICHLVLSFVWLIGCILKVFAVECGCARR